MTLSYKSSINVEIQYLRVKTGLPSCLLETSGFDQGQDGETSIVERMQYFVWGFWGFLGGSLETFFS